MRTFAVFVIAAFLAGCMIGPNYHRPAVDTPEAFRYEEKDAQDTANTDWWKQFGDPALDALIAEALANNRTVKIAAANIEQATGVLMQTRAQLFPQINYTGSGARARGSEVEATPITGLPNPQTTYQLFAGANWEIDLWGRIRRLTEAARAQIFASEEARRGVILTLVASVANNYIQLITYDEQLRIAERTLATYKETVDQFELKFKWGQVSQMNVEQANSQYETAAAAIPPIKAQIVQTENALCILLARNPAPIDRGKNLSELTLPDVPSGLPSQLLKRRPDIAQAEQNLIAANAQIGAAEALYFPAISLTGAIGASSYDLGNLFQGPARIWSYAGSFTGPIFTAGAIAGQVKQAEAAQKAAILSYENAIQSAFRDVENSLSAHKEFIDQLQAQGRLVKAYREYARLARMLYDGGYTQYLTVLYAETQLFPAELSLAQYYGSTLTSLVNVYQAMGGGWVNEADKLTQTSSCK
jgi:multidrug efflux system outer membrane protein